MRLRKKYKNWLPLYLYLIIPIVYIILFKYVPMAGLQLAFKKFKILGGIWGSPWVGLKNFERFFNSYQFTTVVTNTLTLSLYSIFAGFPFPIIFALLLNCVEKARIKKTVQTITYMPHFISTVVLVGMILQICNPNSGLVGKISMLLTGSKGTDIMATTGGFTNLFVWSGVWQNFGWDSIMYLAALTAVDVQQHEAAQIDGASRFQRVLHVDLPAILPTITIMLIMRMGSVMSVGFTKIYLMQNDLNLAASEVISTYEYKRGLANAGSTDFSLSTAIGLFNSCINLIMIVLVNAICRKVSETSLW
ncbi:MAG: sugar ABC transporter permease [Clostridiales bacterium]|nr:sugar ABC transporter permease [Clostridiales bacterium]